MSRVEVRDLDQPEAVVSYELGATNQVRIAQTVVSRHVLQPGWNWEEHARPSAGTPSCELHHRGVVLSGRMGIRTDEGEELVVGPNQVFDLPPGHVTWVEGEDELVMVDWAGGAGFDPQSGGEARAMATILFTDIVDSTARASEVGDASWKRTVAMHDDVVRNVLPESMDARSRPPAIRSSSPSTMSRAPSAAVCRSSPRLPRSSFRSASVSTAARSSGARTRVRRLAVHAAARIVDQAGAGEVLVSRTTRDLAEGATGLTFESRGQFRLKGLNREYELFSVVAGGRRST
jgi:class 3 adenylate cyclase